tara:strand:+ start:281 stop:829 length:549 start_codon:yes stop_codon:yes gene_type:complete
MQHEQTTLTQDVEATLVPQGDQCTLPSGTTVTVTHRLGGNFTVMTANGMFRIAREFAEALGESPDLEGGDDNREPHEGPPEKDEIWNQLRNVFDPEIPVNIVDLGLVYNLAVEEDGPDSHHVRMDMTLTAPGCGMGPTIAEDAKSRILSVPGVVEATVEIVWDPPWTQDLISEEGKMQLGLI